MKTCRYLLLFALIPLLMAQKCANESEETYDESDDATEIYLDKNNAITKEMAIENWELFIKHSQKSMEFTELKIEKLLLQIEEADDYQKSQWLASCTKAKQALARLKAERQNRYKEFESELAEYDKAVYIMNEVFEKQFNQELSAINSALDTLFEKIYSGK